MMERKSIEEWVEGLNKILTSDDILLEGSKFCQVSVFEWEGLTNLIFSMKDVKLNIGKLSMWRLATYDRFGGTWLSDYLPNRLGVMMGAFEEQEEECEQDVAKEKPEVALIGEDGNIFHLMGVASRSLKKVGQAKEAK